MTTDDPIPLDDVLTWSRMCANALAERYAREAHERLMEKAREVSPEWRLNPRATAVVLAIFEEEARKRLIWEEVTDEWLQGELDRAGQGPDD
jgi:hypothetical protein